MAQTGLLVKIINAVEFIYRGRKGLATDGEEHEGRLHFERGIGHTLSAFKEAHTTADCKTLILAELSFLLLPLLNASDPRYNRC